MGFWLTLDRFVVVIAVKAAASRLYDKWKKLQDDYNASQQGSSATSKKPSSSSSSKDKDPVKRKSASGEDGKLSTFSCFSRSRQTDQDLFATSFSSRKESQNRYDDHSDRKEATSCTNDLRSRQRRQSRFDQFQEETGIYHDSYASCTRRRQGEEET